MRKGMEGGGSGGRGGFCVGVETRCMSFTLLMPTIIDALNVRNRHPDDRAAPMSVLAAGCQPCS